MAHGGLSKETSKLAVQIKEGVWGKHPKACLEPGKSGKADFVQCGYQVVNRINHMARHFFQLFRECIEMHYDDQEQRRVEGVPASVHHRDVGMRCMRELKNPVLEGDGETGVLWERKFTKLEKGANLQPVCQEAAEVASTVGAWSIVG